MENGTCPDSLAALQTEYISGNSEFKDATGTDLSYSVGSENLTYTLTGKDASGTVITSGGSSSAT